MIRITIIFAAIVSIIPALLAPIPLFANDNRVLPTHNQGRKWRIGYYEGGSYFNYPANLKTIVAGLVELGWMAAIQIPQTEKETASRPVWQYLARHTRSDYIEFVQDGYWSAQWTDEIRVINKNNCIQRLNRKKDIDFIIAMGTWAGQDLATRHHGVPTMAVSVSNPVRSGISKTTQDSGLDHFHARCDPNRYIRQLRLFHRLARFKRLGVVYENTVVGKTYAAYDDIQKVAQERGFAVVTCEAPFSDIDQKQATDQVIQCHQKLAPKVDAIFVTVHRGIDENRMAEINAPLLEHKVPTWSQRGPEEVKKGILFSISRGGFKAVGRYHAEVMAKVFNGETPRSINQIFEDPKLIAVNTKTAERIGFKIPNTILRIADEVYDDNIDR
jgi:ABC-type uncharacterized transport system substrate-binding protein